MSMITPPLPFPHSFDALAEIAKNLGHAHRLILLEHITQGEHSVERLAALSGLSLANASQHLQHLKRAGFVQTRRNGKHVLYRLGNGPIASLMNALRDYAAHRHAEFSTVIRDNFHGQEHLDSLSLEALLVQIKNENVVLLDVRPPEEFARGHLPGAINIPTDALAHRLNELPPDANIVAYCRGAYCVLSSQAVAALRAHGRKADRLAAGYPEWQAAGLPVERMTR